MSGGTEKCFNGIGEGHYSVRAGRHLPGVLPSEKLAKWFYADKGWGSEVSNDFRKGGAFAIRMQPSLVGWRT
jgi:hypothetical protein